MRLDIAAHPHFASGSVLLGDESDDDRRGEVLVGGGYIFVHRLLMEHFASLTEEEIKRLAGASDGR